MSAIAEPKSTYNQMDIQKIEKFLFHEARLIDEQRWDEWDALFVDEGEYWVPASPGQADAKNHLSLIYETSLLRAVRLKRFMHPNAFSLKPKPRCVHLVSNVMLDEIDAVTGDCISHSHFLMLQYRREEQDVFGGTYTHHLKATDNGFRIKKKRVDLINCDAALGNILLYL